MSNFECDKCGLCCQQLSKSELYSSLDRGDGVCRHFDETTKLCKIYANRPIICNVDEIYDRFLNKKISRKAFHDLNYAVCRQLKKVGNSF